MVRLAFSTNAYTNHSLSEAVSRIADHGYAGVEILGDDPHVFLDTFSQAEERQLQQVLEREEIEVSNLNANTAMGYYSDRPPSPFFDPSIVSADDAERRWRVEYTLEAIELAATVGAPSISVTTGKALPGNPPERARGWLIESLEQILPKASEASVRVGIEYEPGLLIEDTAEVLELIEEIDHPALGVNLDVGHAAVSGEDPAESIRACADRLTGIHLEDIAGGIGGKHYHLIPGEGDLDFAAMFDACADIDYDGYATLELYTYPDAPDEAARRSREYLGPLL